MVFGPCVLRPTPECVKYSDIPWQYLISRSSYFVKIEIAMPHPNSSLKLAPGTFEKEVGSFEGHPFLVPFLPPRCSGFWDRPWASQNPWADRNCISLVLVCLTWVRIPLDDHVEFSLTIVNYRALGTINSLVRWVPFILCIHGSQGLVGEKTLKWAQVLRKKRKELSYYRREEGSKKVLEWANHVW